MADDKFIDFQCPYCKTELSFPESYAGTAQGCPDCLESIVVPVQNAELGGTLPVSISTPRLMLRRLHHSDWKDLLAVMSEEDLFQYVDWNPMDEDAVVRWLESDQAQKFTTADGNLCLGIQLQAEEKLIGFISLSYQDELHRQAGFIVFIGRGFQRQGYGTEAIRAVVDFGFGGIRLHRITARADSRNQAGNKMLTKAGLRCEGEFVKDVFRNGAWTNTVWYALLREEYDTWPDEKRVAIVTGPKLPT